MNKKTLQILLFTLIVNVLHGQLVDTTTKKQVRVERSICLLTGLSFSNNSSAEIGLSKNSSTTIGYHPFASAYFASVECKFNDKFIIGPKIGGWLAGGVSAMALGANLIYYTDFANGSLCFRPEIGFGVNRFKLAYGYNVFVDRASFTNIGNHVGSLVYCFKLKAFNNKTRN